MSTYPYSDSFALIRYILILIVIFGIIGSISQLVSGLFALANAQDVTTTTTTTTTKNIPSNNYHPQDRKSVGNVAKTKNTTTSFITNCCF